MHTSGGGHAGSIYRLDELPLILQRFLVLDIILTRPALDFVSTPLQLLDLLFERVLQLLLLRRICRLSELFVDALEQLHSFGDFLELLQLSLAEISGSRIPGACVPCRSPAAASVGPWRGRSRGGCVEVGVGVNARGARDGVQW